MRKFLNVLIKTVLFFFGWAVLVGVLPTMPSKISAVWRFGAELIPLLIIIMFTVIFCAIDRKEIHIPIFKRPFFNICLGIGTGCVWLGLAVIVPGDKLLSGRTCKIEGSIIVLVLNITLFILFVKLIKKKIKQPYGCDVNKIR